MVVGISQPRSPREGAHKEYHFPSTWQLAKADQTCAYRMVRCQRQGAWIAMQPIRHPLKSWKQGLYTQCPKSWICSQAKFGPRAKACYEFQVSFFQQGSDPSIPGAKPKCDRPREVQDWSGTSSPRLSGPGKMKCNENKPGADMLPSSIRYSTKKHESSKKNNYKNILHTNVHGNHTCKMIIVMWCAGCILIWRKLEKITIKCELQFKE